MSAIRSNSLSRPSPIVLRLAGIKRLLWQGPARILFSIVLVFIAAGLYSISPLLRANNVLYISVLIAFFVGSVCGFETALERLAKVLYTKEDRAANLHISAPDAPYTFKERGALLNELDAHLLAVSREYPDLFEQFRAAAQQKEILVVQDSSAGAELLVSAFHDFGFKVVAMTSPEASRRLLNFAQQPDLIIWNAKSRQIAQVSVKGQFGQAPVLMLSAITHRPHALKQVFAKWLDDYPATFADAFLWHLIEVATAISIAERPSGSVSNAENLP
jgi:CheY-like chemotaxis protein